MPRVYNCFYTNTLRTYDYVSSLVSLLGQHSPDGREYYFATFTREIDAVNYCKAENKRLKGEGQQTCSGCRYFGVKTLEEAANQAIDPHWCHETPHEVSAESTCARLKEWS